MSSGSFVRPFVCQFAQLSAFSSPHKCVFTSLLEFLESIHYSSLGQLLHCNVRSQGGRTVRVRGSCIHPSHPSSPTPPAAPSRSSFRSPTAQKKRKEKKKRRRVRMTIRRRGSLRCSGLGCPVEDCRFLWCSGPGCPVEDCRFLSAGRGSEDYGVTRCAGVAIAV